MADIGQVEIGEADRYRRRQRRGIDLLCEALLRDSSDVRRIVAAVDGDDDACQVTPP